ncbi:MAG: NAD(P)/FAD-dependent oxidoreductase [Verrucomicrobia bacterium]|nr:NAD(P)/FAD-dependent oxidoreductase [Verrucomicrobiota bacterium]
MFDVIIVGGGPAGLSAALALGRSRRKVLLCDKGQPRNAASKGLHGFLTRDGIDPMEFLQLGREDLRNYPSVEFLHCEVVAAEGGESQFIVRTDAGGMYQGRILLLASGIVDELPPLAGIERFYGRTVHHCPYCDGWEHRDQPLAVFGEGRDAVELAVKMRNWSREIVLCPSETTPLCPEERELLEIAGIRVKEGTIHRLEGESHDLSGISFQDGSRIACAALFIVPAQRQRSELAFSLGCKITPNGQIDCNEMQETSVKGVYAVGNAARGLQLVIIATDEGTKAAFAIDEALQKDELDALREQRRHSGFA